MFIYWIFSYFLSKKYLRYKLVWSGYGPGRLSIVEKSAVYSKFYSFPSVFKITSTCFGLKKSEVVSIFYFGLMFDLGFWFTILTCWRPIFGTWAATDDFLGYFLICILSLLPLGTSSTERWSICIIELFLRIWLNLLLEFCYSGFGIIDWATAKLFYLCIILPVDARS